MQEGEYATVPKMHPERRNWARSGGIPGGGSQNNIFEKPLKGESSAQGGMKIEKGSAQGRRCGVGGRKKVIVQPGSKEGASLSNRQTPPKTTGRPTAKKRGEGEVEFNTIGKEGEDAG